MEELRNTSQVVISKGYNNWDYETIREREKCFIMQSFSIRMFVLHSRYGVWPVSIHVYIIEQLIQSSACTICVFQSVKMMDVLISTG